VAEPGPEQRAGQGAGHGIEQGAKQAPEQGAEPHQHAASGLTTLGRCLIAAGISASVCSVVLNERDLLRIGVLVIVLALLAALVAARTRLVVRADRTLEPIRLSAGSPAGARLTVCTSGRLLGGGLVLTDELPDALGGSARFVTRPPRKGDAPLELAYEITPTVRGIHLIGPLTMRVSDPLGLAEYERELSGRTLLTVLPRVTELAGLPDGFGRGEGDSGATGLRRGLGEHDAMVREYQPGDPLRTVHWRSTARRDKLMVRVEERPWHGGVTVLLDRRGHAHRGLGAQASLEWSIELVASVCRHLMNAGRRVTLVAENGTPLSTGRDPEALLDVLATVRPSTQPGLVPPPAEGGELFAVLGAVDPAAVQPLIAGSGGGHGHAVLLDVAAWTAPQETRPVTGVAAPARAFTEAGWSVLVGRPERGPDRVWNDFCKRLPVRLGSGR
jgi:uncharacterized protein (DUF58 family)